MSQPDAQEFGTRLESYRLDLLAKCLDYQRQIVDSTDKWLLALSGSAFVFCFASLASGKVSANSAVLLRVAAVTLMLSVIMAMFSKGIAYIDAIGSIRQLDAARELSDGDKYDTLQRLNWNPSQEWIVRLNIYAFSCFILAMVLMATSAALTTSEVPSNRRPNDGNQSESEATSADTTARQGQNYWADYWAKA